MEKTSKEWVDAMQAFTALPEAERYTPKGTKLLVEAHRHAPEELKKEMRPGLLALINGFCAYLSKPTHCDAEGFTVHTTEDIAKVTGLSVEDMRFLLDEVGKTYPQDIPTGNLHKMH